MTKILYKFAAVLLAAALSAVMVSMMWMGGGVSFSDFLDAGRVYDVSGEELHSSTKSLYYLKKTGEFFVTNDKKAIKRVKLDGTERVWKYLYLDIESMSARKLEADLRYYGKESNLIYEQPVTLTVGENVFELEDGLAVYWLGIGIREAGGERIAISSMQAREKERIEIPEDIWKVFGISFGAVFVPGSILCLCIRSRKTLREEETMTIFLCESLCTAMGRLPWGSRAAERRQGWQRAVLALLFSSCILWNVTGWSTDETLFRYSYLVCALLLLTAGFFSREKPLRAISFRAPVPRAWLMFWVWLAISDFLTTARVHYHEYVMIGAAGFFLVLWAQEEDAGQVFFRIMEALEIVFFLSIAVCLLICPNDMETPYGGIFGNSGAGAGAMYALLMFVTFLTGLDRAVEETPYGKRWFLWEIPGMLLSLYLTVRAEEWMGNLLGVAVLVFFLVRVLAAGKKYLYFLRKRLFIFLFSVAAAVLAVEGFHIGTRYIPQVISDATVKEDEEGVADDGRKTVDEHYLRRLNLYGNAAEVKVFRKRAMTKNGYLFLAYRYGIFVLLPFVLYQLAVLAAGMAGFWKDRKKLWMLGIMLIYIGFSIHGNAELPLAHPLWLCVYLCPGIVLAERNNFINS